MGAFENSMWFALIMGAGAIQGFFVAAMLFKIKKGNIQANKKLSILILLLALGLVGRFAYNAKIWQIFPQLWLFEDLALFLYGPLFYFYLKDLLLLRTNSPRVWMHFIPGVLHLLSIAVQWCIKPEIFLQLIAERNAILYGVWYSIEILSLLHLTTYLVICGSMLLNYNKRKTDFLSFDPKSQYLLVVLSIIFIGLAMWWYNYIRFLFGIPKLSMWLGFNAAWCTITLLNYVLGFYVISNQELFQKVKISTSGSEPKADLENHRIAKVKRLLEDIMRVEKPYLNPDLSVFDLAALTHEPPHVVSKTINSSFGQNFFDFVNSYRVGEFVKLAQTDGSRKLTLLALAFEAGFNSKTAFNKAFKKAKGETPRVYLKNQSELSPLLSS